MRDENGTVADIGKWHGEGDTLHGTQIASIIGGWAFTIECWSCLSCWSST